jgi:hypothetical protein
MQTKDSLYVKVLMWANDNAINGFTQEELEKTLELTTEQKKWVMRIFYTGHGGEAPLISSLDNTGKFTLTASGISHAVDYIELNEARENGIEAKRLATQAIWIGIVVGIAQIIVEVGLS